MIFFSYEDMVINRSININAFMTFIRVESEDTLRNILRLREVVLSRVGGFNRNIIVNDMYLFVTLLSDIMREMVRLR